MKKTYLIAKSINLTLDQWEVIEQIAKQRNIKQAVLIRKLIQTGIDSEIDRKK